MNDAFPETLAGQDARALVRSFHDSLAAIRTQVRKIIVGQDHVVDHLLMTLLVGGHCLITGMPGTAKPMRSFGRSAMTRSMRSAGTCPSIT